MLALTKEMIHEKNDYIFFEEGFEEISLKCNN